MAVIAHISDLHFPYTTEHVRGALYRAVWRSSPKLVVVSGDLTQRAKKDQFAEAQRFVESMPKPQVIIPGNHDVPLYAAWERFVNPTGRFVQYICDDLTPTYVDDEFSVLGLNSTRPFTFDIFGFWKNGTLSAEQLARVRDHFRDAPPDVLRILVMHHPLINPWNEGGRDTARGRRRILRTLEDAQVDVVLSGHLHMHFGRCAPAAAMAADGILCVQAGTACSTRLRGEAQSYNLLEWNRPTLTVAVMRYDGHRFNREAEQQYKLR